MTPDLLLPTTGLRISGKHPIAALAPRGVKDATRDPAVVQRWFAKRTINIGIATGILSNIVVMDVDDHHGGDASLQKLEQRHGRLPPTWRFLTGGGGDHILFRHPGRRVPNSVGGIGRGIDVRGDGGYIVAPPSQHISGRPYAISVDHHPDDMPLAGAPAWLLEMLRATIKNAKAAAKPASHWRQMVAAGAAEGARNQTIASVAGHLLRNCIDPSVALDLLRAWNQMRCNPPLEDEELVNTVRSIAKREIERRQRGDHG